MERRLRPQPGCRTHGRLQVEQGPNPGRHTTRGTRRICRPTCAACGERARHDAPPIAPDRRGRRPEGRPQWARVQRAPASHRPTVFAGCLHGSGGEGGTRGVPDVARRRTLPPAEAGEPPRTPPTGCMQPQEGATNLRVQVRPDGAHCPAEAGEPSAKAAHCRTAATGRGGTPACTAPVSPSDDVGCDGGNASCYMTPLRRMARRPAAPSSISTTEEGSGVGRLGSTVPPL